MSDMPSRLLPSVADRLRPILDYPEGDIYELVPAHGFPEMTTVYLVPATGVLFVGYPGAAPVSAFEDIAASGTVARVPLSALKSVSYSRIRRNGFLILEIDRERLREVEISSPGTLRFKMARRQAKPLAHLLTQLGAPGRPKRRSAVLDAFRG